MRQRVPRDDGPNPVSILATALVLAGGMAACIAIIFTSSSAPWKPLTIVGVTLCGYAFFYWLLGPKRSDLWGALFYFKRQPEKPKLQLRFHRHQPGSPEQAADGPATAEKIRELKESNNVWVPSPKRGPSSGDRTSPAQ